MEWLSQATAFDIVALLIFLVFLVRGIWIGFIRQISSIVAMLGTFPLVGYFDEDFYRLVMPFMDESKTSFLISYILLFLIIFFVIKLVGFGLKQVVDISLMGWFDRTMGGFFGIIKGVFFATLLFMMIAGYMPGSHKYLKKSLNYGVLSKSSQVLLALIQDKKLRSRFIPREPAIQRFKKSLPSYDEYRKPETPDQESEDADPGQKKDKKGILL